VSEGTISPGLVANRRFLERFFRLLSHREPVGLAADALSALIAEFGVTAGSLFYATRPPLRVRRGTLSEALSSHLDEWEASVEGRIAGGPWEIKDRAKPLSATRPIKGTEQVILYSLIVEEDEVIGTISLILPRARVPGGAERSLLNDLLRAIGSAVGLVGELSLTKERLGQLSLFYQVAQSMASTFELDKVLDDTMQLATAVLNASASALMMVDERTRELVFEFAYGEMGKILRLQRTPLGQGIAGWVATHGEPVLANNVSDDARFSPDVDARTGFLTRSVLCAPIQIRGKIIGVIEALNKRDEAGFDAEDLRLMVTTANQAAIAIENARLYQSLRDERDRILQAQEDVRRQVARNLHDGTVQFLSAISMGIDHLERLLDFKPEAAHAELDALRKLTRQATRQARLALFELRPLILETQGLVPALEAYVQQLDGSEPFGVHLEAPKNLPPLNSSVASTIFAIVQEAVTNAKKHAGAREVWLRLSTEQGWLRIVVEDNGAGFDAEAVDKDYDRTGSIGLLSMRERAQLIDGHMQIETSTQPPDSGTRIILRVPIHDAIARESAKE